MIGLLEANEQVTINGIASTGWYRIITSDTTEAFVSQNYITKENPFPEPEPIAEEPETETIVETVEVIKEETSEEVIEQVIMETTEEETVIEESEPETVVSELMQEDNTNTTTIAVIAAVALLVIGIVCLIVSKRITKK